MKKNFKFLSSLALAGVLATNVMGLPTFAAITDNTTKTDTLGIYQKLVEGKRNVVPFVLANTEDRVTIQDIKDSGKFNNISTFKGLAVPSSDTVVCTGDTFTADQKEYVVVVYGDVNKDGVLDVDDAVAVQKNIVGTQDLDVLQQEAADVKNDGEIDVDDAVAIKKYLVGNANVLVNPLPEKEAEESEQYNCEITVNENGYINSENLINTTIGVKLSQTYEKDTELTIKVVDSQGEEIDVSGLSGTVTIAPHTDYIEKGPISFEKVTEKNITIQLLDTKGAIVGTVAVEINTVRPQAALVSTNRTSTTEATMSLSAQGESNIVKMYYTVVNSNDDAPVWDADKNEFKAKTDAQKITSKTVTVSNNKLENALLSNELATKQTYKVYYMLENSYGSQTEEVQSADILSDTVNSQMAKVKTINVPDLSKNTTEFTWEAPEKATGYIVTIYKDGNIIAEDCAVSTPEYDLGEVMKQNGAGKYKISVIAKGDGATSKNSEATQSGEVEVKALKAVSNIAFEINTDGDSMLSWTDANEKNDVQEYQINLYELKENGRFEETPVNTTPIKSEETKTVLTIAPNVVYKAEVIAVAKEDQVELVNSPVFSLEGFYKIEADATLGNKITENSVNLTLKDVKVNGKSATYQVKVYHVKEDNDPEKPLYTLTTTKNVVYKDGEIVIDGLESNKAYAFKLIANVDGIQGESDYITGAHTLSKAPAIRNLTVVKEEKEAKVGAIYKKEDTLIVNGERFDLTSNYSEDFKEMAKVIDTLHANDIVTIEGETVTLKLPSEASAEKEELNFGTATKDMTVVIEGNGFEKTILATQGSEPKEVTLKGANARFDVSGLNAEKIILTNGVIVTGDQEYTVSAGTTVTINGVKVTTQKETVIKANKKELDVTANNATNNLVFENLNAENIEETEATITFIGEATNDSKQLGTITIKTEGGKVTVLQQNMNVSATLNVEVNTGDVVVDDVAFTGNKNITVTNREDGNTTVNVLAKIKAPVDMKEIELKDYTEEEFKKAFLDVTKEEDIEAVRNFINSFGINGKGAKITVNRDSNAVMIAFTEAVVNLKILGIQ